MVLKILHVPISRHSGDDFISWPHTRFGAYSVRSAYNLARTAQVVEERSRSGSGSSSNSSDDAKQWKKLWAMKVAGKMKITLWCFAHNCLPSGVSSFVEGYELRVLVLSVAGRKLLNTLCCSTLSRTKSGRKSDKNILFGSTSAFSLPPAFGYWISYQDALILRLPP